MKLINVVTLLLIAATPLVLGQSMAKKAGDPSGNTEEAIRQLHSELIQAQLDSNTATLDRVRTAKHTLTAGGKRV